jgi:hypothetical protein
VAPPRPRARPIHGRHVCVFLISVEFASVRAKLTMPFVETRSYLQIGAMFATITHFVELKSTL